MSIQTVLLPVFVQVLLTFAIGIIMFRRRMVAFKTGTKIRDIALGERVWPAPATQAQNAYANIFEMPVLFYVVMILAIITRHADLVTVVLAWLFVIFRFAQAYIHITSNYVRYRAYYFGLSSLVLLIMWIWLAVRILTGAP